MDDLTLQLADQASEMAKRHDQVLLLLDTKYGPHISPLLPKAGRPFYDCPILASILNDGSIHWEDDE
jgi:hypothetical protein